MHRETQNVNGDHFASSENHVMFWGFFCLCLGDVDVIPCPRRAAQSWSAEGSEQHILQSHFLYMWFEINLELPWWKAEGIWVWSGITLMYLKVWNTFLETDCEGWWFPLSSHQLHRFLFQEIGYFCWILVS